MANSFKEKSIKYLGRDFSGFKQNLLDYSQAHHSGVFQDYNESSPGMALMEFAAYVGDVLSFYQDMQFAELTENARQIENVTSFAKRLGYRPAGKRAARGVLSTIIEVPSTLKNGEYVPNDLYSPVLKMGAKCPGPNGVIFETLTDVQFSASAPTENTDRYRMLTGSRFDPSTGSPTHFAVRKDVEIIAGETKTDVVFIPTFERFKSVELSEQDVLEILSVTDSDGNSWYEVDYLTQEVVFESVINDAPDSSIVPYVMKIRAVPRRFIVDRDPTTNKTSLIFGNGDGVNFDDELIPNVADFALPSAGRNARVPVSLDPQNFLKTRTLGLSPFNTTLTIKYRVGGGEQTNVPAGSVRSFNEAVLDFSSTNLDPIKRSDVIGSLECINMRKTEGGYPEETVEEVKANSSAFFAAQNRIVTREDYIARIFSMPARFGKVAKCFVRKSALNALALNIHVATIDENGHIAQATPTLIRNIKTYLSFFRMLTDSVNILQCDIINLKIDIGLVISPKFNRNEVLAQALSTVRDTLDVKKMQLGQPIVFSDLNAQLQAIDGVISVYDLRIKNIFGQIDGLDYTDNYGNSVRFDVNAATQSGILYCPENAIFQIKFPKRDISGESK